MAVLFSFSIRGVLFEPIVIKFQNWNSSQKKGKEKKYHLYPYHHVVVLSLFLRCRDLCFWLFNNQCGDHSTTKTLSSAHGGWFSPIFDFSTPSKYDFHQQSIGGDGWSRKKKRFLEQTFAVRSAQSLVHEYHCIHHVLTDCFGCSQRRQSIFWWYQSYLFVADAGNGNFGYGTADSHHSFTLNINFDRLANTSYTLCSTMCWKEEEILYGGEGPFQPALAGALNNRLTDLLTHPILCAQLCAVRGQESFYWDLPPTNSGVPTPWKSRCCWWPCCCSSWLSVRTYWCLVECGSFCRSYMQQVDYLCLCLQLCIDSSLSDLIHNTLLQLGVPVVRSCARTSEPTNGAGKGTVLF